MSRLRRVLVALAFGLLAPLGPLAAQAGGGGPAPGGGVGGGGVVGGAAATVQIDNLAPAGHNWGYLDYFPRTITVHQGEAVTFFHSASLTEPHTVTFAPVGLSPLQALARLFPGGGGPIPDTDDGPRAGLVFPYTLYQPHNCGNSPYYPGTGACSFTGHSVFNSGLLVHTGSHAALPSFTARMDVHPGLYTYFCLIHGPSMSGYVRVLPAGAPIPSPAQNAASAAAQYRVGTANSLAAESHVAASLPHVTAGGHTTWTVATGGQYGRVAWNEFLPQNLSIKAGDTVNWTPGFHTVTLASNPNAVQRAIDPECEKPGGDRSVFAVGFAGCDLELGLGAGAFPNGPPGRAYTTGLYDSGVLVLPRPHPWSASFPNSGTFRYFCLVHPGMVAAIVSR